MRRLVSHLDCDPMKKIDCNLLRQRMSLLLGGAGVGRCTCGATVLYAKQGTDPTKAAAKRASASDIWVACDSCQTWRELTKVQAAELQPGAWECSNLFPGASCSLPDDWDEALGGTKRRRHAQREAAAEALAAQQRREARGAQRAQRAEQRTAGIPAHRRYAPGAAMADAARALHVNLATLEGLDDAGSDPQYHPKRKRQPPQRRSRGAADDDQECASLSLERDAWEECTACQLWVNLGRPNAALDGGELAAPSGVCPGCSGRVEWRGHTDTQEWIQCDDCGRWRTGFAHAILR